MKRQKSSSLQHKIEVFVQITPPPPKEKKNRQTGCFISVWAVSKKREREVTLSYIMAEFKKLA